MTFKSYYSPINSVHDGVDVLQNNAHKVAKEQLVPRLVKKSRAAVRVDPKEFYLYQRKLGGRRCSCWIGGEQDPDGYCPVCYGVGFVGGFDKWGTCSESIDWTLPRLKLVGVVPSFVLGRDERPVMFMLDTNVQYGYVEASFRVRPNVLQLDLLQVNVAGLSRNNSVEVYIKSSSDRSWVFLDVQTLADRLYLKDALSIKIVLKRTSVDHDSPIFSNLFFRYFLRNDVKVLADIPRRNESIAFSEQGLGDAFNTINMFLDDSVKSVCVYDFFSRIDDGTRWKVIDSSPNKPLGILTSHDLTCRLVQFYEPYAIVP